MPRLDQRAAIAPRRSRPSDLDERTPGAARWRGATCASGSTTLGGADAPPPTRLLAPPGRRRPDASATGDGVRVHWSTVRATTRPRAYVDQVGRDRRRRGMLDPTSDAGYRAPKPDGDPRRQRAARHLPRGPRQPGPVRLLRQRRAAPTGAGPLRRAGPTACSTTTTRSSRATRRRRTSRSPRRTSTSTPCSSATTTSRTPGSWRRPRPGPRTSSTTTSTTTCSTCGSSPLRRPRPVDGPVRRRRRRASHYGVWIFFRFLTERYPTAQGGCRPWCATSGERADGAPTAAGRRTPWQGDRAVLTERGDLAPLELAAFAAANRRPGATYDEGSGATLPAAPARRRRRAHRRPARLRSRSAVGRPPRGRDGPVHAGRRR